MERVGGQNLKVLIYKSCSSILPREARALQTLEEQDQALWYLDTGEKNMPKDLDLSLL